MNVISMMGYQSFQRLHPLSIFVQLTGCQANGCLKVTSGPTSWLIYVYQGHLTFASNSVNPFERLERHLQQLSYQMPTLVSEIQTQACAFFQEASDRELSTTKDYRAIEWLVEQNHLNPEQAEILIDRLAKEVIESFLLVTEGSYEFIPQERIIGFPNICQLKLRPLVEHCQAQLQQDIPSFPSSPAAGQPIVPFQTNFLEKTLGDGPKPPTKASPETTPISTNGDLSLSPKVSAHNRYTIACIDDSRTVLQAIQAFLNDDTFSVIMIDDPLKALIQIVRHKPDLILLDVGMPQLDGYELCAMLRRHSNFKDIPIVIVTGHTGFVDRAKAKFVGASAYLSKPFTRPELLKIIFQFLT